MRRVHFNNLKPIFLMFVLVFVNIAATLNVQVTEAAHDAVAVPTFHSIGLYWKPPDGGPDKTVQVTYRPLGKTEWNEGYPLWFGSREDGLWPEERNDEYRGSIVHLLPGTTYEIQLTLEGTSTATTLTATTWSEAFPVAEIIYLPETSNEPLEINRIGSPDGYILYTHHPGSSATIDVTNLHELNIHIDYAAYVIVRGLSLQGAQRHGILIEHAHDIVIEENDISGWGRVASDGWGMNADSAIYGIGEQVERVIIQRNRLHHPRSDSNNWTEERTAPEEHPGSTHPWGPHGIFFYQTGGNHVLRYNHVFSDGGHYFADGIGGNKNGSFRGNLYRDSDVYGNIVENCWDDGIEVEGANQNNRVWGNYINDTYQGIATRSTAIGPMYIWRNVYASSRRADSGSSDDDPRGSFHKSGFQDDSYGDWGVFVFHNTVLQMEGGTDHVYPLGAKAGLTGPMVNTTTRNNILIVYNTGCTDCLGIDMQLVSYMNDHGIVRNNDFDYDLFNSALDTADPGHAIHSIEGTPVYDPEITFNPNTDTRGTFTLSPSSPGYDAGEILPNFNDDFTGTAPDMGAHEADTPPMEFGVNAYMDIPTFTDVPFGHWAHDYIEILYQKGYIAGCNLDPPLYCPEQIMTRAESAVFIERGIHNASYTPPDATQQIFDDVALTEWFAKWASQLWQDGYTSGCGTDPLIYCPLQEHTIAEGSVFYLRMMKGAEYEPQEAAGIFTDVPLEAWYARWVEDAYAEGILLPCQTEPDLMACPLDGLERAMGAYMMVQAKGIQLP
jgi:hypothetical protein